MERIIAAALAGAVTLSLAGAAMADGRMGGRGGMGPQIDFTAADADKDGKLTREEITAHRAARFAAADADKDGKLSAEELAAAHVARAAERASERAPEMVARMLNRADADKDGALSAVDMGPDADRMASITASAMATAKAAAG